MNKFNIGDEVYLGGNYWCGYTIIQINLHSDLDVKISPSGNNSDSFWVKSKDLTFII